MIRILNASETVAASDLAASFLVGRDAEGHWLAVETHGLGGGLFRDQQAALHYAAGETERRPGAVRVCEETLVLSMVSQADLPSQGRTGVGEAR